MCKQDQLEKKIFKNRNFWPLLWGIVMIINVDDNYIKFSAF